MIQAISVDQFQFPFGSLPFKHIWYPDWCYYFQEKQK